MLNELVMAGVIAFIIALISMPLIRTFALRKGFYDEISGRKVHTVLTPRIGGVGIMLAVLIAGLVFLEPSRPLISLFFAGLILFVVGIIDDIKGQSAYVKLLAQIIAALVVLAGGIGITSISLPFSSEIIQLDAWIIPFQAFGETYNVIPLANLVTVAWIVLIINATNLLDGLDGLVGGISLIAFITLLALATQGFDNELVIFFSVVMSMSLLAFLASNFYPARIFIGDAGSYLIGLMLAVLPIYGTTKTTVGVVVIGMAIIDLVWAVMRRLYRKQSPFRADRGHIHHKLLDSGIEHRNVVIIFYSIGIVVSLTVVMYGITAAMLALVASMLALVLVASMQKTQ